MTFKKKKHETARQIVKIILATILNNVNQQHKLRNKQNEKVNMFKFLDNFST